MLLGSHEFSLMCCPDLIQIIFPLAYELELLKVLFSERVVCGFFFLFQIGVWSSKKPPHSH